MKGAWVTLATNDSYSLGALVLAHSLKQVGTTQELAVLVTPGVTNSMRSRLSQVFNLVQEVNVLDSRDQANLRLLQRPELGITFTKLHCWRLTQYEKCVFLDADTLVLQNCDELFEREELSAAPDVGWPDCFNSGVFVYRPSTETHDKLIQFAIDKGSFDGGDQGLLNLYFSDWAHKDISKHLPFIYNVCSTAFYSYLPAFKQFGRDVKIIHFIGSAKPWLQYFDTETKKVRPSGDVGHLTGILQKWWDIFCLLVHPDLTSDMSTSNPSMRVSTSALPYQPYQTIQPPHAKPQTPISVTNNEKVWDPWEEYDRKQENLSLNCSDEPSESHNTNALSLGESEPIVNQTEYPPTPQIPRTSYYHHHVQHHVRIVVDDSIHINEEKIPTEIVVEAQNFHCESSENCSSQSESDPPKLDQNNHEPPEIPTAFPNECETEANISKESNTENESHESGLAGAFSKLTLGQQRSPEQEALENSLRRQNWEQGNIDYLGRDSFDNIWSKICETLAQGPHPGPESTSEEVKDAAKSEAQELTQQPEQQTREKESATADKNEEVVAPTETKPEVVSTTPQPAEVCALQAKTEIVCPLEKPETDSEQKTDISDAPVCSLPSLKPSSDSQAETPRAVSCTISAPAAEAEQQKELAAAPALATEQIPTPVVETQAPQPPQEKVEPQIPNQQVPPPSQVPEPASVKEPEAPAPQCPFQPQPPKAVEVDTAPAQKQCTTPPKESPEAPKVEETAPVEVLKAPQCVPAETPKVQEAPVVEAPKTVQSALAEAPKVQKVPKESPTAPPAASPVATPAESSQETQPADVCPVVPPPRKGSGNKKQNKPKK